MFLGAIYRSRGRRPGHEGLARFHGNRARRDRRNAGRILHHPHGSGISRGDMGRAGHGPGRVWAGPAHEGEQAVWPLRALATPVLDFSGRMPYCSVQSSTMGCSLREFIAPTSNRCISTAGRPDDRRDRATRRRSPLRPDALLGVVSGRRRRRVAGNATAFGERNMRYMLSIDSIWKIRPTTSATCPGRAPSGAT